MLFNLIMIIDDDADDRFFFEDALKKMGSQNKCLHAENGEEALNKLHKLAILPNYIFLDLNMPVMNGIEFLQKITTIATLNHIPVIIYTTSVSPEDLKLTSRLGAKYYLPKTSDLGKLPSKINFAIDMVNSI